MDTNNFITSSEYDVLTVPEAAKVLRIGRNTMYDLIRTHKIKHIKIGRKVLVPRVFLCHYIEEQGNICYNANQIDSPSCYRKGDCR